ncbi:PLP-dependent aminotransferase family protein [Streptomyces vinaceus]|uniref:PLP-dependent aminotransferase family protein n=1 Tax=Streptomyces vinaceus TaxID=1960 RepID=A0A5J6J8Z3_STRVI|nr:PLP-dependent aminotransferase family protein [Streptomyces vinaceus]QEV46995.1 PLP-dependent aminotransferase family protein [Streptomyces vinaceus]GHE54681.1 aminotransferase [Streptomyces vinaceus]
MPSAIPSPAVPAAAPPPGFAARATAVGGSPVREILALTARPGVISFAGGLPAPELFDARGLRAAYDATFAESAARALQYSTTEGAPELREAVAARVTARGLETGPDDLLVTTGSQQALALITATLVEPGDAVLVENPTYLAALQCFGLAGARVIPVPCDDEGILPDALEEIVARERPKALYTVPTFQNPTGRTLPGERRAAVARIAARRGLWLVEDDPYGELRFEGAEVPWLAAHPGAQDRTALLGSFSKVMAPGLRLGWLRAPAALRRAAVVTKQAADLHTSTVDQLAAAHYLRTADLDAHIAAVRTAYRDRRDALLAGLDAALPEGSTWNRPEGGMFVWARLPRGYDATEALRAAIARDVAFVPGAPFHTGVPDPRTLRLSFTTHTPQEIGVGLERLAGALRTGRAGVRDGSGAGRTPSQARTEALA